MRCLYLIKLFLVGLVSFGMLSCHSPTPRTSIPTTHNQQTVFVRNNAYSLLFELMNDEKNVSKVLLIKQDSDALNQLIKEIAKTSAATAEQLRDFAAKDPTLDLTVIHLPPGEEATRKAIAATKTKLLLGNSGEEFERSLILTQLEALNYAAHLATVAANHDANLKRAAWLHSLNEVMQGYHARCLKLLQRSPAEITDAQPPNP